MSGVSGDLLLSVLLGHADESLGLLVLGTDGLAELLDDLGVEGDGLSTELVEGLLTHDVAGHADQGSERTVGGVVASNDDQTASSGAPCCCDER